MKNRFFLQLLFTFLILISYCNSVYSQRIYLSHYFANNVLNITANDGKIIIQPFSEKIIKVSFLEPGQTELDFSHSVVLQPIKIKSTFKESQNYVELTTKQLTILINKNPLFISFLSGKNILFKEEIGFYSQKNDKGAMFRLQPDESIYGTGSRSIPMDRRGYKVLLYNEPHYGFNVNASDLNYCIPLVFSSRIYALLFDNPQKGYIDIGKTNKDLMQFGFIGGPLTYYFIADNQFDGLMKSYTDLTGKQPLPPRWALGNFISRFGYKSEAETRQVVDQMQKEDFPADAVIIDLFWFGKGVHGSFNMGDLSWDKETWPNPEKMIKDFDNKGIKTILITEPFILKESKNFDYAAKNGLLADSAGQPYIIKEFWFGPGGLLDIFKPEAQDWFWEQYKKQIDIGVAGWWGDLGEPEKHPSVMHHVNGKADEVHNIYGHYWDKMLFEKYQKEYPEVRLFNLNRSGFAGSQRFSVFPWSGDVARNWDGFKAQMPIMLGMSLCGLAYMHSDLGGFAMGTKDDELYTRWLQFGVFNPIYRPHGGAEYAPSEPIFFNDTTKKIVREYIKLRYQLMPYNYSLAWQNSTKGIPLATPLIYEEPDNISLRNLDSIYYWGKEFLVAPVLNKGQRQKLILIPKGVWFDFWNDTKYFGQQWITENLTLDKLPVFVKAGSFIPMVDPFNSTKNYSTKNLKVHFYYDVSVDQSSFTMYSDDGKTNNAYQKNKYELIEFKSNISGERVDFQINKSGGTYTGMPNERNIDLYVHQISKSPKEISLNNIIIHLQTGSGKFENKPVFAFWDKTNRLLHIHFTWNGDKPNNLTLLM